MVQVWIKGYGFRKCTNGIKDLHAGDKFRTSEGKEFGEIMLAKGEPITTMKDGKKVTSIKADFFDFGG
jgi:hypothetical protein